MKIAGGGRARFLAVAVLANLCAGSLYSFSVLVRHLEDAGVVHRGAGASGFTLATLAFLAGVLAYPAVARRTTLRTHLPLSSAAGAVALAWAACHDDSRFVLGVCAVAYGAACGQMYASALAAVRHAATKRVGLTTGLIVASFALGSATWSLVLSWQLSQRGFTTACLVAAAVFLFAGAAARLLPVGPPAPPASAVSGSMQSSPSVDGPTFASLWFGFFAVSAAGLAVISQAALFSTSIDTPGPGVLTALLGIGNGVGRVLGGAALDRLSPRAATATIAAAVALALALAGELDGYAFVAATSAIALGYGAAAGAYPAILMRCTTREHFPAAFARLFTAWGLAALMAPLAMVQIGSFTGGYSIPLLALSGVNLAAIPWALSRSSSAARRSTSGRRHE